MWGALISILSVAFVIITTIVLYVQQDNIRKDTNKKLNSLVNQINDSQLYGYNFDKQQEQNIQNVDNNMTALHDAVINMQNNLKYLNSIIVDKDSLNKNVDTNFLTAKQVKVNHNLQDWTNRSVMTTKAQDGQIGASFSGTKYWSHFPFENGTTYIRAGDDNKGISIGDVGNPWVRIRDSWFPYSNNDTYIRPGADGNQVHIGDIMASKVNIGNPNATVNIKGKLQINGDLRICDVNGNNCRTLAK